MRWMLRGVSLSVSRVEFFRLVRPFFPCETKSAGSMSVRLARYVSRAFFAVGDMKTMRSFDPLPRTLNSSLSRLTWFLSRPISSETRRPEEKSSSRIARSRRVFRAEPSVADRSRSISSYSKKSTCRSGMRPISIFSAANALTSCFARYLRNVRRTTA